MTALRLAALAIIYAAQRGSEALGDAIGADARRAVCYDPRPWALTEPARVDESPDLLLDDGDEVQSEYAVCDVLRWGPVVLAADWCPDGRGRWIVLRADRERSDGAEMARRFAAQSERLWSES